MATIPARALFDSLTSWATLNRLIQAGEAEGLYLECKAPTAPQLTRDQRAKLAEAVSGFANTGGGVILWGVSTTPHQHTSLDVLSQLEPIASARQFGQQVDVQIPVSAYPAVASPPSRIVHQRPGDTRGVVVTFIAPADSDPVQSTVDRNFYFRNGDEFTEMPYEMLRRMFAGASTPDLQPIFDDRLVTLEADGSWTLPIILSNESSAGARYSRVLVTILNPEAVESVVSLSSFTDEALANPGQMIFSARQDEPIHRGLRQLMGRLRVVMGRGQRPRRILKLRIQVFADRMRARAWDVRVHLARTGFSVRSTTDKYMY